MAILKQRLSGKQAKLEVNLDEMFGTLFPNNSSLRQAVGQAIIDKIRARTADNKFLKTSGKWSVYSDEYAESIEFKAYGKSKRDVNLKQTGDMLGLMDIIEEKKSGIVIGWTDKEEAAKAHGHITGNVGKQRDFLGLTESEINDLKKEWKEIIETAKGETTGPGFVSSVTATERFVQGKELPKRLIGFNEALQEFLGGEG